MQMPSVTLRQAQSVQPQYTNATPFTVTGTEPRSLRVETMYEA
jgi:hypothetical protein